MFLLPYIKSKINTRKKEYIKNILRNFVYYCWKFAGQNKKNINPKRIKRVIVINKGVIGDLIVSTPMIKALAKKYGKVDVLIRKDMKDVLYGNECINKMYFNEPECEIINLLTANKYDLAIIFSAKDNEMKRLCLKSKIPYIIGNSFSYSLIDILITARTKENPKQHFVLKALEQAKLAGASLEKDEIRTEFYIPKKDEKYIDAMLGKHKIKYYVVIHTGKRGNEKNPNLARFFWSEENFAEIIDYIINEYKLPVVLSGSSFEKERNERIISLVKNKSKVLNFCEKTNLKQWAALIKKAKLLISLNTGATHIASCFNTKTIVINEEFPELWHPWMKKERYIILLQPKARQLEDAIDKLIL